MFSIRRLIASLLLLLVVAGVLPFVLPLKDGKPLLPPPELNLSLPEMPEVKPSTWLPGEDESRQVTVYRWQDGDGNWQYGEQPPAGAPYEAVTLETDANLIQALPKPSAAPAPASGDMGVGSYSDAMDKARGVEGTLQQGHEARMRTVDGE